jgi:magnesium transporter
MTETPVETRPEAEESLLASAIDEGRAADCLAWLEGAGSRDAVHALAGLTDAQRAALLDLLPAEEAAEVIEQLPESQAIDALEAIDAGKAADIIEELPSDERVDFIQGLDTEDASAIIGQLESDVAEDVRRLAVYDEDTAGGLMLTEYLAFREDETVSAVLADLGANAEEYADYNIQYTYIVDGAGVLRGVVPIRRLLLASRSTLLRDLMIADPVSVADTMTVEDLASEFSDHPFIGLPVVDEGGRLVGVVEQRAVELAAAEESEAVYLQSQGIVGGEELRSMPLMLRSRRRLMWLSTNIVLNIIAASIIAMYQSTLEAVIALAVFLPIISDMSGCSGNQAVAVSMRELSLGVIRPKELLRVLLKESSLGLINGLALGVLIGMVAFIWKGNPYLGLVVGVALMANTIVAVCIGGCVPLLLKGLKFDPALASGPILTTITDMCGFLLVLSLAAAMMDQLLM